MRFMDLLVCAVMAVGLAQTFVRASGGPGAWLRTRVADPALKRLQLGELSNCTFCACTWFGMLTAILFFTVPEVVYVCAAALAGPVLQWLLGEVPRRKGMGCNKNVPVQPETPNANPA